MFEHKDIWNAIDKLAEGAGLSTSGLAKKAGLDPTSFNKSKRYSPDGKPRWPSTESLAKILSITDMSFADFSKLVETCGFNEQSPNTPIMTLPLIGWAQAGSEGYFNEDGYPEGEGWDDMPFPFLYASPEQTLYALEIHGDSMLPVYKEGNILIVSPDAQLRRGDRVVVKTCEGEVMVKELSRRTANKMTLISLNPEYEDRVLALEDIQWVARVFWTSQ